MSKSQTPVVRRRAVPRDSGIVGMTDDGVKLMAPAGKPNHFTLQEISRTIRRLRAEGIIVGPGTTASK